MAKKVKQFGPGDVGAELLPIITKGLYRDPLDALREYIQNAIDAKASRVEVGVTPDLVSIRDDGAGMTRETAERAIRLGMSEKNPSVDVGFRGIGVYSAFHICNKLELFTFASGAGPSRLVFDFQRIREYLLAEETRRLAGKPSRLHLIALLADTVQVDTPTECPLREPGTLVMMVGLNGEVVQRLTDPSTVREYLQSVVPLPFAPAFAFKKAIESKFRDEDHRVIELELKLGGHTSTLYRPYTDGVFTHGKGNPAKFFDVTHVLAKGKLGFAWVCLNDARKVLPEKTLRGLLVKKFGFSVGDRRFFASFFSRAVFNNRITGEIIITEKKLVPNASRTEFEPGPVRDSLYMAFDRLAQDISAWADDIQNNLKAAEELADVSPRVFDMLGKIKTAERDVLTLLRMNNDLTDCESRLNTHRGVLQKTSKDLLHRTDVALKEAKHQVATILRSQQPTKGRRSRILRASRAKAGEPTDADLAPAQDRPRSLMEVLQAVDADVTTPVRLLIDYIDHEVLRQKFGDREYSELLDDVRDHLEESI